MPNLKIQPGTPQESTFALGDRGIQIGRALDCDIVLDVNSPASRHHAQVYLLSGHWRVRDLNSANGTKLNGKTVDDGALRDGDEILIGDTTLRFESTANAAPESASPAVAPGTPAEQAQIQETVARMSYRASLIQAEIAKAIIGQKEVVREVLMAIFARGHALMIGLPGLAKTTLVKTVAEVLDLNFRRIQFTPDLMPSDITGTDILEVDERTGTKEYRFLKGPIFTNILLADEINRTPPKTQAALLEAMQEHSVTAAGRTFPLDPPFFVLATQNPLEQEGTYPLPEAQLDRFMFSIYVDYPSVDEEELIAKSTTTDVSLPLNKVLDAADIIQIQALVRALPVSDHVIKYATRLVRATRPGDKSAPDFIKQWMHCGAGPRAVQYLILAAKARAVMEGRLLVTADDIRLAARPVLRHRLFTNFTADSEGVDGNQIVKKLLETIGEPDEKDYA